MSTALTMFYCGAVLVATSAANPGVVSADDAYRSGNCEQAIQIVRPYADKGEPWAQYRLGRYLSECGRSADRYPGEVGDLLESASSYQSTTPWERGVQGSRGTPGFFNARASAYEASLFLAEKFRDGGSHDVSWLILKRVQREFESTEAEYRTLEGAIAELERTLVGTLALRATEESIRNGNWTWRELTDVPANLDAALAALDRWMPEEQKLQFKNMDLASAMAATYFGLGRWLRNRWGLWGNSPLAEHFRSRGVDHAEGMSSIILMTYWCRLNHGRPLAATEQDACSAMPSGKAAK